MAEARIISTSAGPVEIVQVQGDRPPVLFFPGGHCTAWCDCGWSLYTESGHAVVSFSRPGYGGTHVGPLSAAEFAPLVREVCEQLDITVIAAAVGVSFGGLQAVHVTADQELGVPRLVLHSCAPSGLPYPDTRAEAIGGPVLFSPLLQGAVWRLVHRMVRSDSGLRRMMAQLSKLPVEQWWEQLSAADRDEARELFQSMRSDSGFVNDLRQGHVRGAAARRDAMSKVECPTLVTGSTHDRGVSFAHAEDFADAIPDAVLVELDSPSHIFWIGPGRERLVSIVSSFIDD
ncbi:alpha/beta hydrolase [Streptomyces sp. ISL-90]|nr:alpha/beta hydrolase [Streptomyces sp. ISL-90]